MKKAMKIAGIEVYDIELSNGKSKPVYMTKQYRNDISEWECYLKALKGMN